MKKILFICMTTLILLTGCTVEESLDLIENIFHEFSDGYLKQQQLDASQIHKEMELHEMQVHYLDVGQGDATLIRFFDEDTAVHILYDAGDWQGDEVVPYLQSLGIKTLDLIMISHPHADHIGQLSQIIDEFSIEEIWMTGNVANTNLFEETMQHILAKEIHYIEPVAGDVLSIGPLTIEVLHPGEELTGDFNRDSLSARFTYGDIAFMFTGDAYIQSEAEMIKRFKDLRAEFLHLGHHGSSTSTSEAFVQAVEPITAIYSAAANNKYGHPHDETISLLNGMNIPVYGTDEHGNIVVTTNGTDTTIDTYPTRFTETCINVNKATKEELQKIVHINNKRAEQIIELRPFQSIRQLHQINGIGNDRINEILDENKACAQ